MTWRELKEAIEEMPDYALSDDIIVYVEKPNLDGLTISKGQRMNEHFLLVDESFDTALIDSLKEEITLLNEKIEELEGENSSLLNELSDTQVELGKAQAELGTLK